MNWSAIAPSWGLPDSGSRASYGGSVFAATISWSTPTFTPYSVSSSEPFATSPHDSSIQGFRNQLLDRIAEQNLLEAVITVGAAARDAVERWPGSGGLLVQHIMHPSAQDSAALLATWNAALGVLRPAVEPEAGAARDDATYGTEFLPVDHEPVPRRDLPFGMPEWHGVGSHADRARLADGSTDHKRMVLDGSWSGSGVTTR